MVIPFQAAVDLSETNEDFRRAIRKLFAMSIRQSDVRFVPFAYRHWVQP
jgi:hypothetical protein